MPDDEVCVRADGGSGGRWAPEDDDEDDDDDDEDDDEANEGDGARLDAAAAPSEIASGAADCGGGTCFP